MKVLGSSRPLATDPCSPTPVGVLPPNTEPGVSFGLATDPLGDNGLETGGVVAANNVEDDTLFRDGKLPMDEEGLCKSSVCLKLRVRNDKLGNACEGDTSRGASWFIEIAKADNSGGCEDGCTGIDLSLSMTPVSTTSA